ncbi:hypothetical protein IGB42_03019 [Andreprevotia sp. IGB-42]|uniref:potassium channel family protein n=1 Tax=Andreprevotia sp. IGB-42 TaxID=2497473 RepID=UPI00135B3B56|nr:potassium channel family protein [Andreprevotia sp. IGB-42]KAF0812351.1 hypothetical protein IGB42_03019 [Andreprevotia sp. IGB-42]
MIALIAIALTVLAINLALLSASMVGFGHWLALHEQPHQRSMLARLRLIYGVLVLLLLATLAQVGIWAAVFCLLGEFADYATAFYFSAVNFATLGYGDMTMGAQWRMLGPLEAINGSLMLGLFASVLFAALQRVLQRR